MSSSDAAVSAAQPTPALELPEPLRSETVGTWAYDTMSRRVDAEILERTYQDNKDQFEEWPQVMKDFQKLRADLQDAANVKLQYPTKPEDDASAERKLEVEQWMEILKPHVDASETWLSSPWMVSEFYVYRRLMDCLGYWDPSSDGYQYDPFLKQKMAGLESSTASAESVMAKIPQLPPTDDGLQIALSMPLWGNKMDLSLWPADASQNEDVFAGILEKAHENLLHDDSQAVAKHCATLREKGGGSVDIIVDNAGFELVTDLAAAQYLIDSGIAKTVTFQLKSHPTFVSDALEKDLVETVEYYCALDSEKFPAAQAAGLKWKGYLESGQWKCVEDPFWVQGLPMWKMHSPLYNDLKERCDLAIVKGDANYRRLLGDLDWELSSPFDKVVGAYFPCPVCALRTLKAEIGCGMAPEQTERAAKADDSWMVNGRFGVVHFST
eukprot:CAMPEP_0172442402 /NCGR_PEP_ID=MMETSP1065-20121228/2837_1 /TAXON_ID=265537 /ORGANISM="Amphiprora paludosa, Strain CCMP125" /LENGTH=438 /DNA_ID=CAMNT_0013192243 /DNA_START=243 /DNA_END=1559 /DNA_ORIENTATION=+